MVATRAPMRFTFQSQSVYLCERIPKSGYTCRNMEAGMYLF